MIVTAHRTFVVTFHTGHYLDFNFSVHKAAKLWNDAFLRIAMVTASAGTLP